MTPRCLRLRGVPFAATEKDIREFFKDLDVTEVRFDFNDDGRPSGECYCKFGNDTDVDAGMAKDRQSMGRRYIEIFRVGALELLNYEEKLNKSPPANQSHGYVHVFGLPFKSGEKDVVDFFKDCKVDEVVLGKEPGERGRPTGEAYVRFASKDEASKAMQRNGQHLGQRYLELRLSDFYAFDSFKRRVIGTRPPSLFGIRTPWGRPPPYGYDDVPPCGGRPMYRDSMAPPLPPPNFGSRRFAPYPHLPAGRDFENGADSYLPAPARTDNYNPLAPWTAGGRRDFGGNYDLTERGSNPYGQRHSGTDRFGSTAGRYPAGMWDTPFGQMSPSRTWDVAPGSGRNLRAGPPVVDPYDIRTNFRYDPLDYPSAVGRNIADYYYDEVLRRYGNVSGGEADFGEQRGEAMDSTDVFPGYAGACGGIYPSPQRFDRMVNDGQPSYGSRNKENGYGAGNSSDTNYGFGGGGRNGEEYSYGGDGGTSSHPFGLNLVNFNHPLQPTNLYMRGIPFRVAASEIEEFFAPLICVEIKVGFFNDGRATGDGVVEFESAADAQKALKKDHKSMRNRYIELFSSSEISRAIMRSSDGATYKTIGGKVQQIANYLW